MDWQALISDLQQKGLSLSQIARLCKCGQATISDLKGKATRDPSYTLGQALIALSKLGAEEMTAALADSQSTEARAA